MYERFENLAMEDYEDLEDLEMEDYEDLEDLEALGELGDPEEYEDFEDLEDWEDMGEEESYLPRRRGGVVTLPPITIRVRPAITLYHFGFNSHTLLPGHRYKIKRLAARIAARLRRTRRPVIVRLVGHTDRVGSTSVNLRVGRRRATSVCRQLRYELARISPYLSRRVQTIVQTAGESRPARPGNSRQARSYNRRVQVYIQ